MDSIDKPKIRIISRSVWGPIAWHLLHTFSINNMKPVKEEDKHNYYLFYHSFQYSLPCKVCSEHYEDIINVHLPLEEEKINRDYLIHYVHVFHNIVNDFLEKNEYPFEKVIIKHKKPDNENIFTFVQDIYKAENFNSMSISRFDGLYQFFQTFCKLYPNKKIRKSLTRLVSKKSFQEIITPKVFYIWLEKHFFNLKINKILYHN